MDLYKTLLEDFLEDVSVYAAQDPESEELIQLMEDVEGLILDADLRD